MHKHAVFPAWLEELTSAVASAIGVSSDLLNSVCCNKYVTSDHDLYWHSDNEPEFRASEFDRRTFIVSLSFGATRGFGIRRKQSQNPADATSIDLINGDLLVMLGRVQCYFEHRIYGGVSPGDGIASSSSSSSGSPQVRINLTWRFKQRHEASCSRRS